MKLEIGFGLISSFFNKYLEKNLNSIDRGDGKCYNVFRNISK